MKNLFSSAWVALILVFPSALLANLLDHGSFDVFSNGKFDGWHVPRANPDGAFSHGIIKQDDTETANGEGASLAIQFNGEEKDGDEELTFRIRPAKALDVSPETKYRISFHTKAAGGAFLMIVEAFTVNVDKKKKDIKPIQFAVAPEWQAKNMIVDVPPGGVSLGFMIKIIKSKGVAGTVWLDEFSVEEVPKG